MGMTKKLLQRKSGRAFSDKYQTNLFRSGAAQMFTFNCFGCCCRRTFLTTVNKEQLAYASRPFITGTTGSEGRKPMQMKHGADINFSLIFRLAKQVFYRCNALDLGVHRSCAVYSAPRCIDSSCLNNSLRTKIGQLDHLD